MIRLAALRTTGVADLLGLMLLAGEDYSHHSNQPVMTCGILLLSLLSVCPSAIAPLLACRLIALNKNSGVCSVGIGDTARRIIAKAILTITRVGIQEAAGSLQLSAGQISGIEAAVYTCRRFVIPMRGDRGYSAGGRQQCV